MNAVVFDLWNTLIKAGSSTFIQCLADALSMEEDYVRDYIRASSSRNSNVHYSKIVQEIWRYTHNTSLPQEMLSKVEKSYRDFVGEANFIQGAVTCLDDLRKDGYKLGIVSNATSVTIEVVRRLSLEAKVDDVFLSCITGYLKPDPRAFQQASKKWEIDPKNIYVVGDKITTDVLGAKLARMNVLWYSPDVKVVQSSIPVDLVGIVQNLNAVPDMIKSHRGS